MHQNLKKLTMAALLVAIAVACAPFSIPVGAAKCFPIQHLINILSGVFLGPWYAVGVAFSTSVLRNILGTGTLLAFPGSMCGALLCGLVYKYLPKLPLAYLGELVGTAVVGGMLAYPIATLLLGKEAALFTYFIPFLVSSLGGTILAIVLVTALKKSRVLDFVSLNQGGVS